MYSIGDEAIRNACIHSGGSALWVELAYDQNLRVSVRDDGAVWAPIQSVTAGQATMALQVCARRAQRIGARLVISSSQDGTEIVLRVPGPCYFLGAKSAWFNRFRFVIGSPDRYEEEPAPEESAPEENDR